jgi:hypothetical protein
MEWPATILYRRLVSRKMFLAVVSVCVCLRNWRLLKLLSSYAVFEAAGWLQQVVTCMLIVYTCHVGWRLVLGTSTWQCYVSRNGSKPTTLAYVVCSFVVLLKADV